MKYCLQKYTTHQFIYFIYYLFQDNFKISKNDVNPTSTSGDTHKTILIILFELFSKKITICSLKSKENIIFAHNYFRKTNTNQASHCFDFYLSIVFLVKGLDTSNQL